MTTATTSQPPAVESAVEANQFVTVPETTLPGGLVVSAFSVGKYLTTEGRNCPVTVTAGKPVVNVTYHQARLLAEQAGFALLTLSQSAALALNVAGVAANWSSGQVGEGLLMQGLHLGTVRGAVDGKYESGKAAERRGFMLSTGEVVFDVAGHLYTWLFDDVQGDADGVVARAFAEGSPAISAPFPSLEKGMGWYPKAGADWSGYALLRGGCWFSRSDAGVFDLNDDSPDGDGGDVGFRCTAPIGL